jgi:hypothetical protein
MRMLLVIAITAFGCNSDNGEKAALKLSNDLATDAVAKIRVSIVGDRPVDGIFDCVAMAGAETLTKAGGAYAELAKTLTQLCDHDVPLAAIKKSVEKAEAAHAKNPADKMLTECVVNDVGIALKSLKNRDDAKDLLARYAIACPGERLE